MSLSGSAHKRSHKRPVSGISGKKRKRKRTEEKIVREKNKSNNVYKEKIRMNGSINEKCARGDGTCRPHDALNLLHVLKLRAETAVHAEDFLINNGSHRQAVKAVGESLPELDVVPSLALIVKAVYPVNRSALVVAAEDEEVFRVFNLIS